MTKRVIIQGLAIFGAITSTFCQAEVNKPEQVAPNVIFHEGDISKGHCNNGWIILEDYVLVVDANFPSGAQEVIPKIKTLAKDKPIRFAFDTHHHGDHAYGNQVWVENGAVPVAHTGVIAELNKYEPKRWEDTAKDRKDVADSKLKYPTLLFPKELYFDDGKIRVELHHFGVAHTHGDGVAWLPKERILFTGDAVVNGAFNYVGDGNIGEWIKTLDEIKKLKPKIVCPGHGPSGDATMIEDQQQFFVQLRAQAQKLLDAKTPKEQLKKAADDLSAELKKNARIARYIGGGFPAQLEKAYTELGGEKFLAQKVRDEEEHKHQHSHGHAHSHSHDKPQRAGGGGK